MLTCLLEKEKKNSTLFNPPSWLGLYLRWGFFWFVICFFVSLCDSFSSWPVACWYRHTSDVSVVLLSLSMLILTRSNPRQGPCFYKASFFVLNRHCVSSRIFFYFLKKKMTNTLIHKNMQKIFYKVYVLKNSGKWNIHGEIALRMTGHWDIHRLWALRTGKGSFLGVRSNILLRDHHWSPHGWIKLISSWAVYESF